MARQQAGAQGTWHEPHAAPARSFSRFSPWCSPWRARHWAPGPPSRRHAGSGEGAALLRALAQLGQQSTHAQQGLGHVHRDRAPGPLPSPRWTRSPDGIASDRHHRTRATTTAPGTTVTITGGTTAATATATVSTSNGVVTGFTDVTAGAGYTAFAVALDAAAAGTGATAIGSGGVDAVNVTDGGVGLQHADRRLRLPGRPERHPGDGARRLRRDAGRGGGLHPRRRRHRVDRLASSSTTRAPATPPPPAVSDPQRHAVRPDHPGDRRHRGHGHLHPRAQRGQRAGRSAPATPAPHRRRSPTRTGTGTGASATALTDGGAITAVTVDRPAGAGYLTPGMRKFVDDAADALQPAPTCPDDRASTSRRPSRT